MPIPLDHLGLDATEAKFYVALLELGPSTVAEAAAKAGLTRTLGYHTMQKLAVKGLVDEVAGGKIIRYAAQHPRRLIQAAQSRRSQWDRTIKHLESILPELTAVYKVAEKPTLRYQEGWDGIKSIFTESLETKDEILSMFDVEAWSQAKDLYRFGMEYFRERNRRRIHERVLLLNTAKGSELARRYHAYSRYTQYRMVDPDELPGITELGGEINIYDGRTALFLLKKPNQMAVVIESDTLTRLLRAMFELAWKTAQPLPPTMKYHNP